VQTRREGRGGREKRDNARKKEEKG
jgi:hypothetical protein